MSNLDDIPRPLTKLIRLIMSGFYSIEHKLVVDMLVRRRETKEDDLIDVLKIERKHLRSLIQNMRQDKFINVRLIMETDEDVKYKIDHVRRKLETEERDLTSRASFICQKCSKTFTDLETGQIFDPSRGQFRCSYCDGIVDEDPNVRPQADSRFVMAKFNEQMKPIYELLKETEGIRWAINEADRTNISATNANIANDANRPSTSSENTSNLANGSSSSDQQNLGNTINPNPQEQYPVIIDGLDEKDKQQDQQAKARGKTLNPEIEALLLREENLVNSSGTVQESSHDEDYGTTIMMENDSILTINVGQSQVPIDKISDEHVELMTKQQRDEYRRLMQHIYNLIYG